MQSLRTFVLVVATSAALAAAFSLAAPGHAKGSGGAGGGKAGGAGAGSNTKTPPAKAKTVLDVIGEDTSLSKFAAALKAADMEGTLKGAGPFTVLAPSDAAFGKLDATKLADLMKPAAKAQLKAILEGHIVTSKMTAAHIGKAAKVSAMGGVSHAVKVGDDKQPAIDGAKITKADVAGSNGLVQIVDTVLLPADKPATPPAGK
jgi:uncharacterized surface protein with fasciclin (FAS1) repeats